MFTLIAIFFDPIVWTVALCGVLLGRHLKWSPWPTVLVAGAAATAAAVGILWLNPRYLVDPVAVAGRLFVSVMIAATIQWLLDTFAKRKRQ